MLTDSPSSRLDTDRTVTVIRWDAVVTVIMALAIGFSLGIAVTTSIIAPAIIGH